MADTQKELFDCVIAIGVNTHHIQHKGTYKEHFDICQSMKKKAIKYGAKEVTGKDLALLMQKKLKGE